MSPYRASPPLPLWFVEARVKGPLSSFLLGATIEALDAQTARERFEKEMGEAGFVILSSVSVLRRQS